MAIAEKASMRATGSLSGDSGTLAYPNTVASGDFLVCAGAMWQSGGAPTTCVVTSTRTTGNWTVLLGTIFDSTQRTFLAYAFATSSGTCTVTVNPGGSNADSTFSIDAFTGVHATPLDVDGGTTVTLIASGGGTFSDSLTTATANALLLGVLTHSADTRTLTAGTNYTQIGENENNSSTQCHHAEFRLVTTAQAYTVDWTAGTGESPGNCAAQTAGFAESTGAPAVIPGRTLQLMGAGR